MRVSWFVLASRWAYTSQLSCATLILIISHSKMWCFNRIDKMSSIFSWIGDWYCLVCLSKIAFLIPKNIILLNVPVNFLMIIFAIFYFYHFSPLSLRLWLYNSTNLAIVDISGAKSSCYPDNFPSNFQKNINTTYSPFPFFFGVLYYTF